MNVSGIHAVEAALRAGQGVRMTVKQGETNARLESLLELAGQLGVAVSREALADNDVAQQGVVLQVRVPDFLDNRALTADVSEGGDLWLVLDGVTDPRNFGACLRSAATFGVAGVIVPRDHSAPLNEAAIKTASGGASMLRLYRVANLGRAMDTLKDAGVWLVGTVLDEVPDIAELDLKGRIGMVMGAEDTGLRHKTRQRCDFLASIPMPRARLSLNVSVATGVALYEVARQRGGKY